MGVKEEFASRLKHLREIAGYTQGQLADKLGISRGSISFYENGSRTPDIEILDKVCEFLDVPVDYMLGYVDTIKEENENIGLRLGLSDNAISTIENAYFDVGNLNNIIEHENFQNLMHSIDLLLSDKNGFDRIRLIIKESSLPENEKYELITYFDTDELSCMDHLGKTKYLQYRCNCIFNEILEDLYRTRPEKALSKEELEELKAYDEEITKKSAEVEEQIAAAHEKDLKGLKEYTKKHADEFRARDAIHKALKKGSEANGDDSEAGK